MSGGEVVACPRCGSCDPLDTQVQIDYWRGFNFCVMACVCGYGEAAPYGGDFESVSARFYRKEATDLAAAIALAEADARRLQGVLDRVPTRELNDWLEAEMKCYEREPTLDEFREAIDAAIDAQQAEGES